MKLDEFDYIDFGGLSTGRENIALTKFKGNKGLVITDDAEVADAARAMGNAVSPGDAAAIAALEGKVQFCLVGDMLARCESFAAVRALVVTAVSLSRSFTYIQTPWFDSDGELLRAGLKLHWSDWTRHTMPLTSLQMLRAVQPMLRKEAVARVAIYAATPIVDSSDPLVLPLAAGPNSGKFNETVHGAKPGVSFDRPVYRNLVTVIARKDAKIIEGATARFKDLTMLFDSLKSNTTVIQQMKPPPEPLVVPSKSGKTRVRVR